MRIFSVFLCAALAVFRLCAAPVAVVHGFASVAEGERRFAASLAKHVERWYKNSGVEAVVTDDTNLGQSLSGANVAVLVYVAQPNNAQLASLSAFLRRGGKLIVCYSSSPALARLMDVEVVRYLKGSTDGRWSSMVFDKDRPQGVPPVILQSSSNIYLAKAIPGRSRVLAWWHDRNGERTSEPAWIASKAGYWMTHVLLADGDADAKGRLLLALAAVHDPGLWTSAARDTLRQSNEAKKKTLRAVCESERSVQERVKPSCSAMVSCAAVAENAIKIGEGYQGWIAANELKLRAAEIYGMIQAPKKGEIRAVWDHSGMGLFPGEWSRTIRLLRDAGISDLYVNVAGAGFAHYASNVLPRSRVYDEQGDQLKACVAAAKKAGIRVHAWILCFSTEGATQDRIQKFARSHWLLDNAGGGRPFLDPAVREVREYLVRAVREIVTDYDVAGVHLDFVRYPDFASSFNDATRIRFEQFVGKRLPNWPAEVQKGKLRQTFFGWRVTQISDFVQSARRVIKRQGKGKLLTAAVYGKYPSCMEAVGQDWESWIETGLVDYVTPMDYTENLKTFKEYVSAQARTRKQALAVVPGIGVTASESRLGPMEVIDQINTARAAGCPGFALFDLDTTLRQEVLPILRLGISR